MKVGMVVRDLKYGIGTHTSNLSSALRKLNVDVEIIQGGDDFTTAFMEIENGFDIVHVQGSPYRPVRKPKCPLVVTVHTWVKTDSHGLKLWFGNWAEMRTLKNADRVIVVNPRLIDVMYSKACFIPNGVDLSEFDSSVQERKNFFMTAGRDIPRKDFVTFREACKLAEVPHREYRNVLRAELVDAYRTAKGYVCTSYYETGPLTVMEAMAARCPVICTEEVAASSGFNPLLTFPAGNVDKLVEAIRQLSVYTPSALEYEVQKAYRHVSNYTWDNIAKQTLEVYEELV